MEINGMPNANFCDTCKCYACKKNTHMMGTKGPCQITACKGSSDAFCKKLECSSAEY